MILPKYAQKRRKAKPRPGISPDVAILVLERDHDICCVCGEPGADTIQHRINRGMGGSRERNRISNLAAIHALCNGLIESDPAMAQAAIALGAKLHSWADPLREPFWMRAAEKWVFLDDDGGWKEVGNGEVADG